MVCWASIFHADVLRQWNRLDEALDLVLGAIRLSEQTETIVALYLGYTVLMRVYLARGEMDAARRAFQHAEEALMKTYSPYRRDAYLIVDWVQFWLASGELQRAIRWAQELAQQTRVNSPFAREREEVARARMLLAQKRPTEVLSLLEPLLVNAEKQERLSHVIEMQVLQALAHHLRDEEQDALDTLAQAVHLAEPEGYIRSFVDEGTLMYPLLTALRERERKRGPTPYLDSLLDAFAQQEGAAQATQPLTSDHISPREREVLHLLAQGCSNQEIADALVVTVETVKRHVSSLLAKLGVDNRTQAAMRAHALGLYSEQP
jgi:LuxR family maltose regulon positive regulatory protein